MRSRLTWACAWGCAGLAVIGTARAIPENDAASADVNPYAVITNRNIFNMNPPPPPPAAEEAKPADLPQVMLTGFIGKGISEKVLLAIRTKEGKGGDTYLSLLPGEKGGDSKGHDVELLRIHLKEETVDIINSGTPQTLSAKSNSFAASGPATQPGAKPGPGMPSGMQGLHRGPPGVTPPNIPQRPEPSPRGATAARSEEGSVIMAGAGGASGSTSGVGGYGASGGYGGSSGGAIVSGGSSYNPGAAAAEPNAVGSQIANALFNGQNGQPYRMPTPTAPPAPPAVQAAGMLIHQAAMGGGGPPLLPSVQAAAEEADGGPPPP